MSPETWKPEPETQHQKLENRTPPRQTFPQNKTGPKNKKNETRDPKPGGPKPKT